MKRNFDDVRVSISALCTILLIVFLFYGVDAQSAPSKKVPATPRPTESEMIADRKKNEADEARSKSRNIWIDISGGLDALGPVQYQTFAYSEVTDTETFDPNLLSVTGGVREWWNLDFVDLGVGMLLRATNTYENTVNRSFAATNETVVRKSSVQSVGGGFGFHVRRSATEGHVWLPKLGVIGEYSRVNLKLAQNESSQSQAVNVNMRSELAFGYLQLSSDWAIWNASSLVTIGLNLNIPFWSSYLSHVNGTAEQDAQSLLNHRTNPGIGVCFSLGKAL